MKQSSINKVSNILKLYFNDIGELTSKKLKHRIYLVDLGSKKYVLKGFSTRFSTKRLIFTEALHNYTNESLGLRPLVVQSLQDSLSVENDGVRYELTEYVSNIQFDKNKVKNVEKFFYDIGTFVGKLHSVFAEFEKVDNRNIESLLEINLDYSKQISTLIKEYSKANVDISWVKLLQGKLEISNNFFLKGNNFQKLPQHIVHGDLYPENVLFGRNQKIIGLVDYAQAGYFYRPYEVMRACVQLNKYLGNINIEPNLLNSYMRGYFSTGYLDDIEISNMVDLYVAAQAADLSFLSVKTIKGDNAGLKKYAKYRYKSLISLNKHKDLLNQAVHSASLNKRYGGK